MSEVRKHAGVRPIENEGSALHRMRDVLTIEIEDGGVTRWSSGWGLLSSLLSGLLGLHGRRETPCLPKRRSGIMKMNYRESLLEGLWGRLARHARSPISARAFVVEELTHQLSCKEVTYHD